MHFRGRGVSGGDVLLLGGCIVASFFLLAGAGCNSSSAVLNDPGPIPDKETYLLNRLDRKFENSEVHCELGRFYLSEGRWDKANYHLKVALGFDPAHRKCQAAFISMLEKQGKSSEAALYVGRYQGQLFSSPTQLVNLGKAFSDEGLDVYALSTFQKALQIDPDLAEAHKHLGLFYLSRDKQEQAKQYLSRSFALNPKQSDVANELGRMGVIVETPQTVVSATEISDPSVD
jgi:Tfp pilus assembly protein PilF